MNSLGERVTELVRVPKDNPPNVCSFVCGTHTHQFFVWCGFDSLLVQPQAIGLGLPSSWRWVGWSLLSLLVSFWVVVAASSCNNCFSCLANAFR